MIYWHSCVAGGKREARRKILKKVKKILDKVKTKWYNKQAVLKRDSPQKSGSDVWKVNSREAVIQKVLRRMHKVYTLSILKSFSELYKNVSIR